MDDTVERYNRSAHCFDIRVKYCAANRLVVEQVQDDPRRKKTARRRLLKVNLIIVDRAAIFPVFFRMLRQLSRPNAAKSVANSGGEDGIGVTEIAPSVEILKLPKLSGDPSEPSNPAIESLLTISRIVAPATCHYLRTSSRKLSFDAFTELTIPCKSPHARAVSS
jgi:hypothetical protein